MDYFLLSQENSLYTRVLKRRTPGCIFRLHPGVDGKKIRVCD